MKTEVFHEALKMQYIDKFKISILFSDGITKEFDISILFNEYPEYEVLTNIELFKNAKLSYFLIRWNDELDLETEYIYKNGITVVTNEDALIPLFGFQIKKARLEKDMSQKKLSKLTNIDQGDISKIENGLSTVNLSTIMRIAKALNKKIELNLK